MTTNEELVARITDYLSSGGLFNPEMADHDAVRDLLMDCRRALTAPAAPKAPERLPRIGERTWAQRMAAENAKAPERGAGSKP